MQMQIIPQHPDKRRCRGFTLPDYMVGLALTATVFGLTLGSYVYGAKMYQLASTRFEGIEETRPLMARIIHDVRSATSVQVGQGDATRFTRAALGQPQQGNALQVYLNMNSNKFVRYYLDAGSRSIKRVKHDSTEPAVLAEHVITAAPFTVEDIRGNVVTNDPAVVTVGVSIHSDRPVFGDATRATNAPVNGAREWTYPHQVTTRVTPRTSLGYQQGRAAP
jgi:type II secretory pathway component PulJ